MALSHIVAYVTGAGQGLGRATALRFAKMGAKVCVVDLSEKAAMRVCEEIGEANSLALVVDVTNEDEVRKSIAKSIDRFGKINANVNCAGIAIAQRTLSKKGPHNLEAFAKVLNVNTVGTYNTIRLTAEMMAKNDADQDGIRGVVVNTASIAAYDGQIGQAAYAASKGAVVGMTLPIARDLSSFGIRVCTIAPG